MKIRYMHTLDGHPAQYLDGEQICYSSRSRPIKLAKDLRQIKREKIETDRWRRLKGYTVDQAQHGWLRIVVS